MGNQSSLTPGLCLLLFAFAGCASKAATASQVSGAQWQQLCLDICTKASECSAAGATGGEAGAINDCNADCAAAGQVGAGAFAAGCEQSQLVSEEGTCLEEACATYGSCIQSAVASTGCAGGSGGDAASISTNGDSGVSCALCDQAGTCCAAVALLVGVADASDAGNDCAQFTTAACNAAGVQSGAFADNCEEQLIVGQDYGIAACK
jgi:hypothetical protein